MTFELAISTMYKDERQCIELLEHNNIHCDCIIINQCDIDKYVEKIIGTQCVRIFFTKERGLSKSRNMAIKNIKADIMCIGDDDLFYYDNFQNTILDYYSKNPNIDLVIFNIDNFKVKYSSKSHRCCFVELSKYHMSQVAFTKKLICKSNIRFNEYFGTGSEYFQSGEENIFIADCYRLGIIINYCPVKILKREERKSSWFFGITEDYIKDRGAIYYAISRKLYPLYIFRFAILRRKRLKPFTVIQALKLIKQGKHEYLSLIK